MPSAGEQVLYWGNSSVINSHPALPTPPMSLYTRKDTASNTRIGKDEFIITCFFSFCVLLQPKCRKPPRDFIQLLFATAGDINNHLFLFTTDENLWLVLIKKGVIYGSSFNNLSGVFIFNLGDKRGREEKEVES